MDAQGPGPKSVITNLEGARNVSKSNARSIETGCLRFIVAVRIGGRAFALLAVRIDLLRSFPFEELIERCDFIFLHALPASGTLP